MRTAPVTPADLAGVFAVPPLARRADRARSIDLHENARLRDHITSGGITRLLYGGNAFLYHVTLGEYDELLAWLADAPDTAWMIPSLGPSFGRAMDQAVAVRRHGFPCAMLLPCADPRDAGGLERGAREIAEAIGAPLMLYLKDVHNWGVDVERGLDAIGRLVDDGVAIGIKYAIVRNDPAVDPYLEQLVVRVNRQHVVSGIGERPAIVHAREWRLPGFTTGSGCIAPALSQALFERLAVSDFDTARRIREAFLPFEDLRDEWGPARVLHEATRVAGIAETGPIVPFVSSLEDDERLRLAPVVNALVAQGTALHG